MLSRYPSRLHRSRVLDVLRRNSLPPSSLVYIAGDRTRLRHDTDCEVNFRQESCFYYLTGVDIPNSHLLINIATGFSTLFVERISADHAVWIGAQEPISALSSKFEFDEIKFDDELPLAIQASNPELTLVLRKEDVPKDVTNSDYTLLFKALIEARITKTPFELEVMRKACKISSDAHAELMKFARPGQTERDLEARFLYETAKNGCRYQAYTPIVAAGMNPAVLHYVRNDAPIKENDTILVDAGGELHCYASDITRTYPANGKFSPELRTIYSIVLKAQKSVIEMIKPNVEYEACHREAARVIGEGLKEAGIIKGTMEELNANFIPQLFFPHGIGHLVGLDVHDIGGYPEGVARIQEPGIRYLRLRRTLTPGMCVTVEPGIYFVDGLLQPALADPKLSQFIDRDVLEKYRSVGGVRIEDIVAVTETGNENFVTAPKEIEDVERIMRGDSL